MPLILVAVYSIQIQVILTRLAMIVCHLPLPHPAITLSTAIPYVVNYISVISNWFEKISFVVCRNGYLMSQPRILGLVCEANRSQRRTEARSTYPKRIMRWLDYQWNCASFKIINVVRFLSSPPQDDFNESNREDGQVNVTDDNRESIQNIENAVSDADSYETEYETDEEGFVNDGNGVVGPIKVKVSINKLLAFGATMIFNLRMLKLAGRARPWNWIEYWSKCWSTWSVERSWRKVHEREKEKSKERWLESTSPQKGKVFLMNLYLGK